MTRPGKARLGRGLGALLGDYMEVPEGEGAVRTLPLSAIVPNPLQPRREFSEADLAELSASIAENGLLQPVVVREAPSAPGRFELVAGERRFRALLKLRWTEVPAVVRDVDDRTLLVLALVENLQREALNPLEEADGYQRLAKSFDLTQGEIATAVGKNRSTVANTLRLLQLPPSVRRMVESGKLSAGHARALLSVADSVRAGDLARRAVAEGWSVREVERRVKAARGEAGARSSKKSENAQNPVVAALKGELQAALGTRVKLRSGGKGKGSLEVPFRDHEDFERIFKVITGREASDIVS